MGGGGQIGLRYMLLQKSIIYILLLTWWSVEDSGHCGGFISLATVTGRTDTTWNPRSFPFLKPHTQK